MVTAIDILDIPKEVTDEFFESIHFVYEDEQEKEKLWKIVLPEERGEVFLFGNIVRVSRYLATLPSFWICYNVPSTYESPDVVQVTRQWKRGSVELIDCVAVNDDVIDERLVIIDKLKEAKKEVSIKSKFINELSKQL